LKTFCNHGDSADSIEMNKFLLMTLLEEQGKAALLRTRHSQLNEFIEFKWTIIIKWTLPLHSSLGWKITQENSGVTTDQQNIHTHALSFNEDLCCAEPCDRSSAEQHLCDLPQLSEEYLCVHLFVIV